jgi:hypothetical protein
MPAAITGRAPPAARLVLEADDLAGRVRAMRTGCSGLPAGDQRVAARSL